MSAAGSDECGDTPAATLLPQALSLISEPFLMPMRLHAFAALMLGDFRLPSFLK